MTTPLIDTHCHLDRYRDPIAVLNGAIAAGIDVVAVTEDPGSYRTLRTRLGPRRGVEVALGLHPLRAGTASPHDVARFLRLVPQARWIGEIGLDFSTAGIHTRKQQLRIFETLLADPLLRARPVTVHSRGAERDTITRLAQAKVRAIMHWYTGPLSVVDDALAAGLWFSVNPGMLRSAKSAAALARIPSERVLLETDGPYAKLHRRAAEPPDILATLAHLAQLWNTTTAHAREIVVDNQAKVCADYVPLTPDD